MSKPPLTEIRERYDRDYKIVEDGDFDEDGKLSYGEYKSYYSNGQIYIHCFYKDGQRDGEYKRYYSNGQIYIRCFYKDGKADGKYIHYYSNGQIYAHCFYKDGKKMENT